MKIEIQPHSLLNLQYICEVLYKLHPKVLDYLVDMQRSMGSILGIIDLERPTLKEREFLSGCIIESQPIECDENFLSNFHEFCVLDHKSNIEDFYEFKKRLKLNTDEYIPITITIEIEDAVIGRKVRELVRALEKTGAPEQFTMNKNELDIDAYFAEGYGLTMNEEQKKRVDDFYNMRDSKHVLDLLVKERIHPYK